MAMVTSYEKWRQEGNQHYKGFSVEGLTYKIRQSRLASAITSYNRSMGCANDHNEMSSANKNYAQASWKMACLLQEESGDDSKIIFHFKESIRHFSKALDLGKDTKSVDWVDHLTTSYNSCIQEYLNTTSDADSMDQVRCIESAIHCMQEDTFKADCFIQMGKLIFIHGIEALHERNFQVGLDAMTECYRPIEEAKRLANGQQYVLDEVNVLEQDVFYQKCVSESLQAVTTGDTLLHSILTEDDHLNVDGVFDVIDWYKKACILTRETDVEMEAIALSRLGSIYHKVLKRKAKAKECFVKAVQLAHSLHPRVFTSEDWFKLSVETLDHYQKEIKRQEDKDHEKERAETLSELKDELKNLNDRSDKGNVDFLVYVYKTYPPKKPGHTLPGKDDLDKLDHSEIKKTLVKAILHYHPDKQDEGTDGKKWKVLCEEITKRITARYEILK